MKAIRPLLSLVIAMSLAPIAVAQTPATDAPVLTQEFPDDLLEVSLKKAFLGLSLSNNLDFLTKDGESYATRFDTLDKTIEPLCHVATLPTSHAIVERCSKKPAEQVTSWRRFIASLLQGNPSNTKPSNRPDAASGIYLIDESGKTLTPVTRENLPQALLKDTSSAPPLSVSFDRPCKFPATPTGAKVTKLCTKSLPIPPFSASIKGDTLTLKRLQNEKAEAFISFGQEPAAPRMLIKLWEAGTNVCIANSKKYKDTASFKKFRSLEVPFGSQCKTVTLTCKATKWFDGKDVVEDVTQFPGSCTVQKPKSCALEVITVAEGRTVAETRTIAHGATLPLFRASKAPVGKRCQSEGQRLVRKCENGVMTGDKAFHFSSCDDTKECTLGVNPDVKTIKDKGTIDAYKLKDVDSSTGRTCSEERNMMKRTCTNGQLSGLIEFRFATCTARPMSRCAVDDKTNPLGFHHVPHGDTREVFLSPKAELYSSCASVKRNAQCLNGKWFVGDRWITDYPFSVCEDLASVRPGGNANPGGPGGNANIGGPARKPGDPWPGDGICETSTDPENPENPGNPLPNCGDSDCCGKPGCAPCAIDGDEGTCGNGIIDPPLEACDDGNKIELDGCSSQCMPTDTGICGDGNVHPVFEHCDDGNTYDGDGCSSACVWEDDRLCGNGIIDPPLEVCDDGNKIELDGCSSQCMPTDTGICGDGNVHPGIEACDDGNRYNGDGCNSDCFWEN